MLVYLSGKLVEFGITLSVEGLLKWENPSKLDKMYKLNIVFGVLLCVRGLG